MAERPKINFLTYAWMLFQTGLISLGKAEDPISKTKKFDLEEAKSIIELMELLEEKTKGNLTDDEQKTLRMTLDSLRMGFVEASKNPPPEAAQDAPKQDSGKKDEGGLEVN